MKEFSVKLGYNKKSITHKNGNIIDFYIKSTKDNKAQKPLFLYLLGSGPCPVEYKVDNGISSSILFNQESIAKKFHLVIVTKPFIPFCTDESFEVPDKYYEIDSLDYYAETNSEVINYLIKNGIVDRSKIVICGASSGADVASKVALINKNITHVACIAGCGLLQSYNFIIEVRKEFRNGKISEKEADEQINYIFSEIEKIYANPNSLEKFWGHTYKYWYSFIQESSLERLLKLDIPIFIGKGTEDINSCIEGTDIIPIEFIRHNKNNLTYKSYWGANHQFLKVNNNRTENLLNKVISDFWNWLEKN